MALSHWDTFLQDMSKEEFKNFVKLSKTAQLKAFKHWVNTEGQHIDYSFKN